MTNVAGEGGEYLAKCASVVFQTRTVTCSRLEQRIDGSFTLLCYLLREKLQALINIFVLPHSLGAASDAFWCWYFPLDFVTCSSGMPRGTWDSWDDLRRCNSNLGELLFPLQYTVRAVVCAM